MNSLIPANFGAVSTKFANANTNDDLSSGIQSSYGLIGYKGKVWSIRYRGEETQLMRDDGDGPRGSIEVVILKAPPVVSKVYYEQGYVEGSSAAPDCFSNNGVTPEPTSTKKQCDSCALCPMNQWGSRTTPAGKAGKACADSKRLAVVPLNDIENEMFGGPMLLRVPAASLQDLAMYGQKMNQLGYPYYAIGTRISFDVQESYPKFIFNAIRPLSDDEADLVLAERDGHTVSRILSESEFAVAAPATSDVSSAFEQPPETAKPAATGGQGQGVGAQAKAAAAKTAASTQNAQATQAAKPADKEAAKKAPPPPVEETVAQTVTPEVTETDEEREERELLEKMEALKAKKAAAAKAAAEAEKQAKTQAKAEVEEAIVEDVTEETGDSMNAASSFENELDDMLNDLLP